VEVVGTAWAAMVITELSCLAFGTALQGIRRIVCLLVMALQVLAISTVMASQQPCKQAKSARPVWGETPRFVFPLLFFDLFFEKNDPILSKMHLRNHNKKEKKQCLIMIQHRNDI